MLGKLGKNMALKTHFKRVTVKYRFKCPVL